VLCGDEEVLWFNPQVPCELACNVLLSRSAIWNAVRQDSAVLVTTPRLVLKEMQSLEHEAKKFAETLAFFVGTNIGCVICDEADLLFPRLPMPTNPRKRKKMQEKLEGGITEQLINVLVHVVRTRYRNRHIQFVCASATANRGQISSALDRIQNKKWPKRNDYARRHAPELIQHGLRIRVARDGRHHVDNVEVPPTISHKVALLQNDDFNSRFKVERLEQVACIATKLKGDVLIFLPTEMGLEATVGTLQMAGLTEACKHRSEVGLSQDTKKLRDESLDYTRIARTNDQKRKRALAQPKEHATNALLAYQQLVDNLGSKKRHVLVAKADDARGIDLMDVPNVILVQLPFEPTDYLHLAGRTGRMGREGTVISIANEMERDAMCPKLENSLGITFEDYRVPKIKESKNGSSNERFKELKMAIDHNTEQRG